MKYMCQLRGQNILVAQILVKVYYTHMYNEILEFAMRMLMMCVSMREQVDVMKEIF